MIAVLEVYDTVLFGEDAYTVFTLSP